MNHSIHYRLNLIGSCVRPLRVPLCPVDHRLGARDLTWFRSLDLKLAQVGPGGQASRDLVARRWRPIPVTSTRRIPPRISPRGKVAGSDPFRLENSLSDATLPSPLSDRRDLRSRPWSIVRKGDRGPCSRSGLVHRRPGITSSVGSGVGVRPHDRPCIHFIST